ncbi:MAG: cytochrome c-type biogenesis protein CcmH [Chloroflexi bacterium]|nr:cytochrome c-type biogenesis protein CcmH [Chloroflexota bacterium]
MTSLWADVRAFLRFSPLLFLLPLSFLLGCVTQSAPSLEEEAQRIDKSLMCPVCPGETIDQSQAALANQMQAIVREKLAVGETRQEILDFFVERYGEGVLAAPHKKGFSVLAWVIPGIGVLLGMGAVAAAVRKMMRRGEAQPPATMAMPAGEALEGELAPYLAKVDEELGRVLGSGYHPGPRSTEGRG